MLMSLLRHAGTVVRRGGQKRRTELELAFNRLEILIDRRQYFGATTRIDGHHEVVCVISTKAGTVIHEFLQAHCGY